MYENSNNKDEVQVPGPKRMTLLFRIRRVWILSSNSVQALNLDLCVVIVKVVFFRSFRLPLFVHLFDYLIRPIEDAPCWGATGEAFRCFGVSLYRTCRAVVMTATGNNWVGVMLPADEARKRNILIIRVVIIRFVLHLLLGVFRELVQLPSREVYKNVNLISPLFI